MTTIAARWFYRGRNGKTPRLIVMHCTVSPEMGTGAEDVARYFANLPATNKASAHKVVDDDSIVTCVDDDDTAFAAAGANNDGLHLELVGQPTQTRDEWLDQFSTHELAKAQTVIDAWSTKYAIPLRWLTVGQVADGVTRGMCTHADVSAAFPKVSTGHWDPGPNFPKDTFPAHTGTSPHPTEPKEDLVQFHYARLEEAPDVYIVNMACPPRKIELFDDVDYWAAQEGHKVLEAGTDTLGADGSGKTRKGIVIKKTDTRARKLFGFAG